MYCDIPKESQNSQSVLDRHMHHVFMSADCGAIMHSGVPQYQPPTVYEHRDLGEKRGYSL